MSPAQETRLQIGAFDVSPLLGELSANGTTTKLEPRAMGVLVHLASRPGAVVSFQELLDGVWGDVVVTPDSVYQAIAAIRRALGDDPKSPQYIVNVPRRGYRLVATVTQGRVVSDTPAPAADSSATYLPIRSVIPIPTVTPDEAVGPVEPGEPVTLPAPARPHSPRRRIVVAAGFGLAVVGLAAAWLWSKRPGDHALLGSPTPALASSSIAVLPFLDMSEQKDQEYFSDGLAEELLDLLAQIPGLQVVARTSSFSFKGKSDDVPTIARKLQVTNILEGSVRRAGTRLRVTTQLIRADTGTQIWSETYDRELKDVFTVQDEIATAVVAAMRIHLLPSQHVGSAHRTASMEAYNEYLLARQLYNSGTPDGRRHAVEAFRRSVAFDSDYAAAYAGLAAAEYFVADMSGDVAGFERAAEAADRAVTLAPAAADGYAARGFMRCGYVWDWNGSLADFEKAVALDPSDSVARRRYGQLLSALGRVQDAIAMTRKATELDPLSNPAWGNLGRYLTYGGDYTAAHAALHRALQIQPNFPFAMMNLGLLQMLEGKPVEARATFTNVELENFRLTAIAMAEHTLHHTTESQRALDEAIAKHAHDAAYQIAQVYAWRGQPELAFQWLERAYEQRDGGLVEVKVDPLLATLRGDPRYATLLRKMHLPL